MQEYFKDRQEFRLWLNAYHDKESELWLIYYKKHTGKACINYADAVEEALCFGWIDGKVQRIDDRTYKQRFTPRKPNSKWSLKNKETILKLQKNGRVHPAGLKTIENAKKSGAWHTPYDTTVLRPVPEDLMNALKENSVALTHFMNFTPSQRSQYVFYIDQAKKTETRIRRITRVVERAHNNLKPGMM